MSAYLAVSGVAPTYADISEIVEALVHTDGRRYPVPGMDHEDVAQEIRLECLRVLEFFDPTRIGPSPYKYLQTCVRNFLYNMRRGIWVPNNPPCVRCPMWNRLARTCTIEEIGCDKIVQYRESMATKADLKQPATLDIEVLDDRAEQEMDATLLDQSIRDALPKNLVSHYENLVAGKTVPARAKKLIRDIVTSVINNA